MALIEIPDNYLDFLEDALLDLASRRGPVKIDLGTREDFVKVYKEIVKARIVSDERVKANGDYR